MRVFLTGGSGCLGANIAKHLIDEGFKVRLLLRKTSSTEAIEDLKIEDVIYGDIRNYDSFSKAIKDCQVIIHCAALITFSQNRWKDAYLTNVIGTKNMIKAGIVNKVKKFIHTSSVSTIGYATTPNNLLDENSYNSFIGLGFIYHRTKWIAEQLVLEAVKEGLNAVVLNPSIIFGERDVYLSAGRVFKVLREGTFVNICTKGGVAVCDADNVAKAFITSIEKGKIGERYILSDANLTNLEFLKLASSVMGLNPKFYFIPKWLVKKVGKFMQIIEPIFKLKEGVLTGDILISSTFYNFFDFMTIISMA